MEVTLLVVLSYSPSVGPLGPVNTLLHQKYARYSLHVVYLMYAPTYYHPPSLPPPPPSLGPSLHLGTCSSPGYIHT